MKLYGSDNRLISQLLEPERLRDFEDEILQEIIGNDPSGKPSDAVKGVLEILYDFKADVAVLKLARLPEVSWPSQTQEIFSQNLSEYLSSEYAFSDRFDTALHPFTTTNFGLKVAEGSAIAISQSDLAPLNGVLEANSGGLKFSFNAAAGTPRSIIDGFIAAGKIWSSLLADDVTVNIDIAFESLAAGTLGSANPTKQIVPYRLGREQLIQDATSLIHDGFATNNLPDSHSIPILINHTAENAGSHVPYLDDNGSFNNANVVLTNANAKAIGLAVDETRPDGLIRFNRDIHWDFNRHDGIAAGASDFVGVAGHEIGHILGFSSQADTLDFWAARGFGPFIGEDNYVPTLFDLFRFSSESVAQGAIDLTADSRGKYFSFYRGAIGMPLSSGKYLGDGEQASHWKDIGIGIMDPTMGTGTPNDVTLFDRVALDVIGWDLA